MKYFVRHLIVGLMIFALAGVLALGKDKIKRESVTFPSDTTVNGTLVKAGTYDLKFDEQTGDLEILKGKKVIAKTTAHLQERAEKAHETKMNFLNDQLVGITFRGDRQDIVIGQGSSTTGMEQ